MYWWSLHLSSLLSTEACPKQDGCLALGGGGGGIGKVDSHIQKKLRKPPTPPGHGHGNVRAGPRMSLLLTPSRLHQLTGGNPGDCVMAGVSSTGCASDLLSCGVMQDVVLTSRTLRHPIAPNSIESAVEPRYRQRLTVQCT